MDTFNEIKTLADKATTSQQAADALARRLPELMDGLSDGERAAADAIYFSAPYGDREYVVGEPSSEGGRMTVTLTDTETGVTERVKMDITPQIAAEMARSIVYAVEVYRIRKDEEDMRERRNRAVTEAIEAAEKRRKKNSKDNK